MLLQLAAYFAAQYIEFASLKLIHRDGRPVGFFEYYDFAARSFAWKQKDGTQGEPLGAWGYAFRGLEVLGFVAGGLIVPIVLRKAPYCDVCQRYMRQKQLALFAASVPARKVKKSDIAGLEAYKAEQEQALETGKQTWERLRQLAEKNQAADFQKAVSELGAGSKQAAKLPIRLSMKLVSCARCQGGWLLVHLVSGQGRELKQTEFARADVHPEFVRGVQPSPTGRV
jgi:hypothetical protein